MGIKFLTDQVAATAFEVEHQLALVAEAALDGASDVTSAAMANRISDLADDLVAAGGELHTKALELQRSAEVVDLATLTIGSLGLMAALLRLDRLLTDGFFSWSRRAVFAEIAGASDEGRRWMGSVHDLADNAHVDLIVVGDRLLLVGDVLADLMAVGARMPPTPEPGGGP